MIAPAPDPNGSPATAAVHPPARRRRPLVVSGVLLVATGLTVSGLGSGPVADLLGDALYAALVWVVLAGIAVRWPVRVVTVAAVVVCAAVEAAQLTGVPAALTAAWAPARYLLGTTFAAPDLLAYAAGAAVAGAVASVGSRRRPAVVSSSGRRAPEGGDARARVRPRVDPRRGGSQGKA